MTANETNATCFRWADRLETETAIHNLVGLHWDVYDDGECVVRGCDTAWMLAHARIRRWRQARRVVLRAIAGRGTGLRSPMTAQLTTPTTETDRQRAEALLAEPKGGE